jgi:ribosomal protein S13
MYNIDNDMSNYNKIKDLVIDKLVAEGELKVDVADEIKDRIQVLIYKGKWYKRYFEKNVKQKDGEEEGW